MRFEVRYSGGSQYMVDLNASKCGCRRWDLTGLPCMHAIACIDNRGLKMVDFVNDCYKKTTYEKAYNEIRNPMNGPAEWRKTDHTPIKHLKRETNLEGQKKIGHNQRTCTKPPRKQSIDALEKVADLTNQHLNSKQPINVSAEATIDHHNEINF
ncbi:Zinc finger, PMZ-type [Parasponia andersonii]|uniref:Zinc finger, PMZ-type n=1 Tax=Parasponia andersonii TaxID=3476 RepID=A0A2P5ADD8_PARAD|nr:Zinc finger, PMZ-type [Parasponia andersonii]